MKKQPKLAVAKTPAKPEPLVDEALKSLRELNDSIADLATEVGGKTKQGSTIWIATARVQEALHMFKEAHSIKEE